MADSIVRLRVDSQEYDQKLKRAAEGLQRYADQCRKAGGTLQHVEQETLDYVKALGQMDTKTTTATGKIAEMKKAFTEFSMIYRSMSDEEKNGDFGRALGASLENLKVRINDSRQQLAAINQELSGSKFGQMGQVIDTIGQQFGVTGNLTEMLTSKTALLTTALGGVASAAAYAAKEWAEYNSQLAKQDQITTVTTGLKGTDAEQMTSAMRALSRTYGADFRESVNAANTLMTQFGVTGSDAIQLLRDGMQGMILGDAPKLLSMIQQFAPSFHDAGVSASQLVAVIQNSEGGIFTDQNMQAIVMGIKNLRLMTKSTAEALAQLGINGQDMSKKMSDGSLTVFDALKQVAGKLKDVNSGSREAGEVMQAVFGRQGAMAGTNLAKAIETLNTDLETTKKQTGNLGDQMNELQKANERLEVSIRNCFGYDGWQTMANGIKTQLITALAGVIDVIDKIKNHTIVGNALSDQSTIFGTILSAAKSSLGPLADVWNMLRKIKNLATGGSTTGSTNKGVGYSDIENRINKIQSLDTREKRERGYNQLYQELQRKYQTVGRERYQNLGNGKGRFYIASDKTQAVERDALERRMKLLETRKESILEGKPIEPKVKVESDTTTTTNTTTTTTTTHQTPQQRAQESFAKAEQSYKQALEQAAMELQAGTITRAEAKKKEMQAAEQRWKAIGDARNINDSENLRKAQDEAAAEYKRLAAEAKTATERQKAVDKATRDLENANQKLATARSEMAQARQHGDLQAYNTAKDKATAAQKEITRLEKVKVDVERGKVDLPDIPNVIEQTVNTHQGELMTAEIAKEITQTINTRLGRIVTPDILESITQTINTKIGRVVTPDILESITQTINTKIGRVVKPEILEQITQTINTKIGKVATPPVAKEVDQTVNTKQGKLELADIPTEVTQTVDVETGRVDLKPIPTEITQKVDVEQGDMNLPDIPKEIEQIVNTHQGEMMTAEIAKEITQTINTRLGRIVTPEILESITQTINTKIGRVVTPDILESITQTINTKIGKVVTPAIAKELTQEVNVKTGKVDLKPIPTEITQTVDVEQGDVNLPAVPTELTQTVDVETGRVNLLNIPEVIEQVVNTHQGELMTADIATEITQKINTVLGNIVKPEILDEVTQTINTKVGEVITPEIAKEVTQVVNVETGTVDLEPIPTETTTKVIFQADTRNINAAISDVKKEMDTIPVGTIKFNLDQTKLVDLTTLKTLIDEQVKNGLEIDPEATQGLFSKIQLGIDIEDTTWQDLIDKINEKLKELDIEPISINFKTGDTAKTGKETENAWKNAASAVQSVGSALQQIEDPSAKIAGIIGQAIANIALGFAQATAASSGGGIFAWIAAITGGVATMISTISAIHSTTGYADGGIVKGNRMSGDQVPAMLNSGELVLNKFQQQVLAANLQAGGLQGLQLEASVHAEQIRLALNNNGKRTGRGELVTWKR